MHVALRAAAVIYARAAVPAFEEARLRCKAAMPHAHLLVVGVDDEHEVEVSVAHMADQRRQQASALQLALRTAPHSTVPRQTVHVHTQLLRPR